MNRYLRRTDPDFMYKFQYSVHHIDALGYEIPCTGQAFDNEDAAHKAATTAVGLGFRVKTTIEIGYSTGAANTNPVVTK